MRQSHKILTRIFFAFVSASSAIGSQIHVVAEAETQSVFGGTSQVVVVKLRNSGNFTAEFPGHIRLYQTSSVTAVPFHDALWKQISILPHQTIVETAEIRFPAVKAPTRFLVRWLENTNAVIGTTDIFVYPTNVLSGLKSLLTGAERIGLLDPADELKPSLAKAQISLINLGENELKHFAGKLLLINSQAINDEGRETIADQIRTLKNDTAVLWIHAPKGKKNRLRPSFYSVPGKPFSLVMANPKLVENFSTNPESQSNLVELCRLALNPRAHSWNNFETIFQK